MNKVKTLLRGDLEMRQTRDRDCFRNCHAHFSFAFLSPCSLPTSSWCSCCEGATLGDAAERGETGLGDTNSAHLWLSVANAFSPGLEDKRFNNPECCALCLSKVDSLHSASLAGISLNLLGKCWTNRDPGWDCPGLALHCLFFIVRLILLCHMVKDWSLASRIAGGRQEKLLCICLQVSSINECTDAALNKNAREGLWARESRSKS